MSTAITNAVVGGLLLLMFGWLKLDINRLADKIDRLDERLSGRIDSLSERIARIEGRLDEREDHRS
jgi:hypothetical protein